MTGGGQSKARLERFSTLSTVRAFETRVAKLYRESEIPGFVHTSLGQEAVAVGIGAALEPDDYLSTGHRGHGHVLAKGADPDGMMAELFGKEAGLCSGKGGSMHVADPSLGILGANAIVGASIPLAVGAGVSSKLLGQGRVSVGFFGEGAVNQGMFHEAINLAAIWHLPVLMVCENNLYAEFTDSRTMSLVQDLATRVAAYGVSAVAVDGNDVEAVYAAAVEALGQCRRGDGPAVIEARTYRWHGHYEGDGQPYKPEDEVEEWRLRDPLVVARRQLLDDGVADEEKLDRIVAESADRIDAAVDFARDASVPADEVAREHVFQD